MKKGYIAASVALSIAFLGVAFAGGPKFLKGKWFAEPELFPATQTIGVGGTITANACGGVKRITSTAARTTDTTNTFTAPSTASDVGNAGCVMDVINDSQYAITLDYNALFNSASAGNVVLGSSDTVRVASDGAAWYQIGGTGDN